MSQHLSQHLFSCLNTCGVSTPLLVSQHLLLNAKKCLNVKPDYTLRIRRNRANRTDAADSGTGRRTHTAGPALTRPALPHVLAVLAAPRTGARGTFDACDPLVSCRTARSYPYFDQLIKVEARNVDFQVLMSHERNHRGYGAGRGCARSRRCSVDCALM